MGGNIWIKRQDCMHMGGYRVYWLVLLLFAFPMRVLLSAINGIGISLSLADVIRGITAVGSLSVRFGWYIYFFALAVITYPLLVKAVDNLRINGVLLCYLVCGAALILRFFLVPCSFEFFR